MCLKGIRVVLLSLLPSRHDDKHGATPHARLAKWAVGTWTGWGNVRWTNVHWGSVTSGQAYGGQVCIGAVRHEGKHKLG